MNTDGHHNNHEYDEPSHSSAAFQPIIEFPSGHGRNDSDTAQNENPFSKRHLSAQLDNRPKSIPISGTMGRNFSTASYTTFVTSSS